MPRTAASPRGPGPARPRTGRSGTSPHAGAGRAVGPRRVAAGREPVRRAAAPGPAAALRLPAGDGRRAGQLGGAQGPDARPVGAPRGVPRRGPPARVLRLRGRHPGGRVRRRGRHRLGRRDVGPLLPARGSRPGRRGGARRAAHGADGPEAQGQVRPGPDVAWTTRARRAGCCCTRRTSSRRPDGTRRSTPVRCCPAGPTTRSRRTPTGCGGPTCRSTRPRSLLRPPTFDPVSRAELRALDRLGAVGGRWEVFGRELRLTNLDKVLFPAAGAARSR